MTTVPLWIQLTGLALALSGWAKVAYDLLTSRPRVRGRIFNVMTGQMPDPRARETLLTTFTAYLYLVNTRKNSVHLLDYEMEVKVGSKWCPLERVYGIHNIENLEFGTPDGQAITGSISGNLINRKDQAAEFGKPLHGWIMFAGPAGLYGAVATAFRLKCVDAYGKRHVITNRPSEFGNLNLLQELANISVPESARRPPTNAGGA